MASAITAVFTFIGNYLLRFLQKGIQPFLTEILKIVIERVFVPILLSRTGLVTALMILMFCGLTGKRKFLDYVNFHARTPNYLKEQFLVPFYFLFTSTILSGVIVETLCLTGYRSFRTVLLGFQLFLDMMLMPTASLDNLIGKT